MKRIAIILAAVLLAGCDTTAKVGAFAIIYLPHGQAGKATVTVTPPEQAASAPETSE